MLCRWLALLILAAFLLVIEGIAVTQGTCMCVCIRVCARARALNIIHYHLGKFVERARKKHVVLTSNSPGASRLRASRSLFRMHSHAWLRVSNGSANGLRRGFQGEGRGDVIR